MRLDIEMDCKPSTGQWKLGHMDYVSVVLISGPAHAYTRDYHCKAKRIYYALV
jgi:hypothetical protein